jgi:hypothetical protein
LLRLVFDTAALRLLVPLRDLQVVEFLSMNVRFVAAEVKRRIVVPRLPLSPAPAPLMLRGAMECPDARRRSTAFSHLGIPKGKRCTLVTKLRLA